MNHGIGFLVVESGCPVADRMTGMVERVLKEGGRRSGMAGFLCECWRWAFVWMWHG